MRGDRGGSVTPKKKKKRRPSAVPRSQKTATIWSAEQLLAPFEVPPSKPVAPISDVSMESRRYRKPRRVSLVNVPSTTRTPQEKRLENDRYRAALVAPIPGAKFNYHGKKIDARTFLATTMTPQRRREHAASYEPLDLTPRTGVERALGARIIQTDMPSGPALLPYVGRFAGDLLRAGATLGAPAARPLGPAYRGAPLADYTPEQTEAAGEALFGRAPTNLLLHGDISHPLSAAVGLAAAGIPIVKPARVITAAAAGARALPEGRAAALAAYRASMDAPSLRSLIREASQNKALLGPERDAAHTVIDAMVPNKELARRAKRDLDATVHAETKDIAPLERKAAIADTYNGVIGDARQTMATVEAAGREALATAGPAERAAVIPKRPGRGVVAPERFAITDTPGVLDRYYPIKQRGAKRPRIPGLPKTVKSRAMLGRLVEDMAGRLEAGLDHASEWYPNSGREILAATGGDVDRADLVAQLTAIYSPQKPVAPNIALALRVLEDWDAGRGVRYGNSFQRARARQALRGEDWMAKLEPNQLPKVRRFYANLLKHIAPERLAQHGFTGREVTVDGWMGAAFGYGFNTGNSGLTEAQFRFVEDIVQRLADHYGLEPEAAQAAIWTSIKAERDKSTAKLYANPETRQEALARAGESFAESIFTPRNTLRLPLESMTSAKPWMQSLTPEQLAAHTSDYGNATLSALHAEGFIARYDQGGIGFWRDPETGLIETNPAIALEVALGDRPVTRMRGKEMVEQTARGLYLRIPPGMADTANGLAAAIGDAAQQAQSGWHRYLNARDNLGDVTAYKLTLGRSLTHDETQRLVDALPDDMHFSPSETGGVIALNDPNAILDRSIAAQAQLRKGLKKESNAERRALSKLAKERQVGVDNAVAVALPDEETVTLMDLAHRGGLIDATDYQAHLARGRRSDLFVRVRDRLARDFEAIDARYQFDPAAASERAWRAGGGREPGLGRQQFFYDEPLPEGGGSREFRSAPMERLREGPLPERPPLEAVPPEAPPPVETPSAAAPAPQEGPSIAEAIQGAKPVREQIEAGYSPQRAARLAAGQEAFEHAGGGVAGLKAFKTELQGKYSTINYQGFNHFTQESVEDWVDEIFAHPGLTPFERIRAAEGLTNAVEYGQTPQRRQLQLLETVFPGQHIGEDAVAIAKSGDWKGWVFDLLNVPRALQSSFDLSAPFRQGLVAGARHPVIFGRNFKPMLQAAKSEGGYEKIMAEIQARPNYNVMEDAGVAFTDVGQVGDLEERYASHWIGKVPGIGHSARAYTGFLNKMRADMFDSLYESTLRAAAKKGVNERQALEGLARYVNAATGRGGLGKLAPAADALNTLLFSPRLLSSRLSFLNPYWYYKLPPGVRKEAIRAMLQTIATGTAFLGISYAAAQAMGLPATVGLDPRSANFGKLKIGNHRWDIWGGFQPLVRYATQFALGQYVSSTTGTKIPLGGGKFGATTRLDIAIRFLRSKEAPNASLITDWADTENVVGDSFQWRDQWKRISPLIIADFLEVYQEDGGGWPPDPESLAKALGNYGVAMWGIGSQTYGPTETEARPPQAPAGAGLLSGGGGDTGLLGGGAGGGGGLLGP